MESGADTGILLNDPKTGNINYQTFPTSSDYNNFDFARARNQIKRKDCAGLKKTLESNDEWSEWKQILTIDVTTWTNTVQEREITLHNITLLHLAVIERDIDCVKTIVEFAGDENLDHLFFQKINVMGIVPDNFEWLKEANAVHLSAWFHNDSLDYFIQLDSRHKDDQNNRHRYSPLHICAMKRNSNMSSLLEAEADVRVATLEGQTPLQEA